ncbi:MAG: hypothetical protein D6705_01635 [Deltaproteobacteria bacterium]|nr:MAG: hypothetical protein D6705_01635 [Deltaproteobacteria bacterium]
MATFTLRRFTNPATLKSIRKDNLIALLDRHRSYFVGRGVTLQRPTAVLQVADGTGTYGRGAARVEAMNGVDYEGIARVLMTPDESTPCELVDDLFFVDEMATPEGMDALREEIERLPLARRRSIDLGSDPTPADVAVMVRLHAPDILEHKHAEGLLVSKRSFQYFVPANGKRKPFPRPTDEQLRALEAVFDDAFEKMKRGRSSKIFVFERGDEVWMLVRHGDPCKREGALSESGSSSVYYRPEVYDVLRYDRRTRELSVSAGSSKKIYTLYREKIGLHLFGDELHFPAGKTKFTLDPLKVDGEDALVCVDVDGMESVVLRELHYYWGGPEHEVEIRRASNLFEAFKRRNRRIPDSARIVKGKFEVKFTDSKAKRMVTITNSNVTSFTRDSDASAVEDWMTKRGFALVADGADA